MFCSFWEFLNLFLKTYFQNQAIKVGFIIIVYTSVLRNPRKANEPCTIRTPAKVDHRVIISSLEDTEVYTNNHLEPCYYTLHSIIENSNTLYFIIV